MYSGFMKVSFVNSGLRMQVTNPSERSVCMYMSVCCVCVLCHCWNVSVCIYVCSRVYVCTCVYRVCKYVRCKVDLRDIQESYYIVGEIT